jgi:hypothetical protein
MTPLNFIIIHVLAQNVTALAERLDVAPTSVHRWLRGDRTAPIERLRPIFSAEAARRNLPWSDSWLFEVPTCNQCVGPDQCRAGCARIVDACAAVRGGDVAGGMALAAGCGAGCGFAHVAVLSVDSPSASLRLAPPPQAGRGQEGAAALRGPHEPDINEVGNGKPCAPIPAIETEEPANAQAA